MYVSILMSRLGIFIKGPLVHLLLPGLLTTALIFTPLMQLQTYVPTVIDTERRFVSHRLSGQQEEEERKKNRYQFKMRLEDDYK